MSYTIMKYLRISSEDIDLDGLDKYESNSIAHQRALLDDFISKMAEFEGCDILEAVDDGRTGTNFQRPGVQKVFDLAQRGKVQCIVVKDAYVKYGLKFFEGLLMIFFKNLNMTKSTVPCNRYCAFVLHDRRKVSDFPVNLNLVVWKDTNLFNQNLDYSTGGCRFIKYFFRNNH